MLESQILAVERSWTSSNFAEVHLLMNWAVVHSLRSDDHPTLHEQPKDVSLTHLSATQRRPSGGFAASRAFTHPGPAVARDEYTKRVLGRLIWPGSHQPTFDECLLRVQQFSELL